MAKQGAVSGCAGSGCAWIRGCTSFCKVRGVFEFEPTHAASVVGLNGLVRGRCWWLFPVRSDGSPNGGTDTRTTNVPSLSPHPHSHSHPHPLIPRRVPYLHVSILTKCAKSRLHECRSLETGHYDNPQKGEYALALSLMMYIVGYQRFGF